MQDTLKRKYRCLDLERIDDRLFSLVPIRDQDQYPIMEWRNAQQDILRQSAPITKEMQEKYFREVVAPLFEADKPGQLLFSFLENGILVGYGGLVHINWNDANAEISFLLETGKNKDAVYFENAWRIYLGMISTIAFRYLSLHKIYTYAYSTREDLFPVLEASSFVEEARLKEHVLINGVFKDVVFHRLLNEDAVSES